MEGAYEARAKRLFMILSQVEELNDDDDNIRGDDIGERGNIVVQRNY